VVTRLVCKVHLKILHESCDPVLAVVGLEEAADIVKANTVELVAVKPEFADVGNELLGARIIEVDLLEVAAASEVAYIRRILRILVEPEVREAAVRVCPAST
jgi:hypothetical protein